MKSKQLYTYVGGEEGGNLAREKRSYQNCVHPCQKYRLPHRSHVGMPGYGLDEPGLPGWLCLRGLAWQSHRAGRKWARKADGATPWS